MAHFAKIESNLVTEVIVAEQDFIDTLSGEWVQTSYNTHQNQHATGGTALRGNYAGIGYYYDRTNDVFYPQQPFASWTLNTTNWTWEPPIPVPDDAGLSDNMRQYLWDEDTQSWTPIEAMSG